MSTGPDIDILLAEDNEDDVFLILRAFRKAGAIARLHAVSDGVEAREYLMGEGRFADREAYPFPDLVLLDLNMPRMNGFELLAWMRRNEECRRVVVHVLSASAWAGDVDRVYELGANSYLVKPSRLDNLVGFVGVLLQWHGIAIFPQKPDSCSLVAHDH